MELDIVEKEKQLNLQFGGCNYIEYIEKHRLKLQCCKLINKVICATEQSLDELVYEYLQNDAEIIIWQQHRIICGEYVEYDNKINLEGGSDLQEAFTIEVRVFNRAEELHLYYEDGKYEGRYLCDSVRVIRYDETHAHIYCYNNNGYYDQEDLGDEDETLFDYYVKGKGAKEITYFVDSYSPLLCAYSDSYIVTRNYISVNEKTGQVGYGDYRFVSV